MNEPQSHDAREYLDGAPTGELRPGMYMGKDGHRYQVLSDGTTYRMLYRKKMRVDKNNNRIETLCGPTLIRVGTTRIKVAPLPAAEAIASGPAADSNAGVEVAAGGAA